MVEIVTIGSGDDYYVYATIIQADTYLNASMSAGAIAWRALSDPDDKARYLVTATRVLDAQRWKGTKTDPDQPLAWPRTGTGITGVEDDVIPQDIINASIELAAALVGNIDIASQQSTESNIQSLKAGSAAITFFRGVGTATRFPNNIMELLRDYLAGYDTDLGGVASSGTSLESVTGNKFGYSEPL